MILLQFLSLIHIFIVKKTYPDKRVEMVDVNPRAVLLAKDNAQRNNVDVYAHESNIYEQVEGKDYTDILTNPPIRAGKRDVYKRQCGNKRYSRCHGWRFR